MTNLHKDIIQYYVKLTILYYFTLNFLLQSLFNVILNYKIDCKYIIRGVGVWNFIPWGGAIEVEASDNLPGNDNANGAVKVARSMYPTSDTTHKVTSTLCYGVQWDAALNFIDPNYESGTSTGYVKNSTNMGNYSGFLATTGSNAAYQQKHIYDMAGNVYEWTMEAVTAYDRVARGGGFSNSGSSGPASIRYNNFPDYSNGSVGFRLALYL